jgi:NADH dehydrogenase FAD-containing subunit
VRRRLLTFVVVGGGYSGVETAGQISDLLRHVGRFYPRLDSKEFRLVLVHSGPYLLPQIGEKLGRYCGEHLQKQGIEGASMRAAALTAERAILDTSEVIETNTVGNATHPVIKNLIDRYRLALNKATFEALAQNSLALGFLLSPSAVEYLTLEERKAIVDPISAVLRDKRVADFMRADPVVVARRIR